MTLCWQHKGEEDAAMIALGDLVDSLGHGLIRLVVPAEDANVTDVALAEAGQPFAAAGGDLVFGVGHSDADAAVELVRQVSAAGAAGLVLRRGLARNKAVREVCRSTPVALLELADNASLVHVVGLLRGVIERSFTPGLQAPDSGVHSDLFTLADAVAALVRAPVTFEDAQSRVLAYSSQQDVTDLARVSTIVGRRVPEELVAHLRSRGVFRRLSRSDDPFVVQPGPTQTLPRLVVPVRAGREWLGSIWVVVQQEPPPETVRELRKAASVLALHLLRLRAQADLTRRVSSDRLRSVLTGTSSGALDWLPPGPWRVVALSRPEGTDDLGGVDLWDAILRRHSWHQPLVAELDGTAYALVTDAGPTQIATAGSWEWLRRLVALMAAEEGCYVAAAGARAAGTAELGRSRQEAAEVMALHARADQATTAVTVDDAWAGVTLARAAAAAHGDHGLLGGPLPVLKEHDETRGTAYLATLTSWLDHLGEPRRAARALHIHPNTLRYRMQRMSQVSSLDLDEPSTRLVLRVQLAALGHWGVHAQ